MLKSGYRISFLSFLKASRLCRTTNISVKNQNLFIYAAQRCHHSSCNHINGIDSSKNESLISNCDVTKQSKDENYATHENLDISSANKEINVNINSTNVPGTPGDEAYVMAFTCGKCNTRAARRFSKKAYHDGLVIIRCPGCQVLHLVADNIGWMDTHKYNIEMEMKGKMEFEVIPEKN